MTILIGERRRPALGVSVVDLGLCNWARVSSLVLSPGIPLRHPKPHRLVKRARAAGVRVIGDMELFAENQPERRIVGITGTNGKSTTSALIAHILDHAGIGTQLGGNIGLPVLDLLPKPVKDIYVLELSSYQLDLTERLKCAVAVILNLSPDHLDRHGGMAGYLRAKKRILRNQEAGDWAVVGVDDDYGQKIVKDLKSAKATAKSCRFPRPAGSKAGFMWPMAAWSTISMDGQKRSAGSTVSRILKVRITARTSRPLTWRRARWGQRAQGDFGGDGGFCRPRPSLGAGGRARRRRVRQ